MEKPGVRSPALLAVIVDFFVGRRRQPGRSTFRPVDIVGSCLHAPPCGLRPVPDRGTMPCMSDVKKAEVSRSHSPEPVLTADVGGTNARFGLCQFEGRPDDRRVGRPEATRRLAVADHAGLAQAAQAYLGEVLGADRSRWPRRAAIALATPIEGDHIRMTNSPWSFSVAALRRALGWDELLLLNDFTALAWSLDALPARQLRQIGGGLAVDAAARALIGPGTGLGVSGLIPVPGARQGWAAIEGEGGHASLSPLDPREAALLAAAWQRQPHVSFERFVCGTGLPLLCECVAEVDGYDFPDGGLDAAAITARGLDGDPLCLATLDTFCAMLGTAAANLALSLGARGGVFIGGGIVPRLGAYFAASPFRARFESKGRFSGYLARIPTWVIDSGDIDPALLGAARALLARGERPVAETG